MKVVKVTPQGYCYGVVRAINIVKKAATTQPQPIYILGDIVHNRLISKALENYKVITIESKNQTREQLLDQINEGTIVFTAHGVSPVVYNKALEKNLNIVDATCPEVSKTQENIKKYLEIGYHTVFIGQKNHPEAEACVQIDVNNITFLSNNSQIPTIPLDKEKYYITYQSTLNKQEVEETSNLIEQYLSDKLYLNTKSVCDATTKRQDAVLNLEDIDFLIVIGDENSNNTNKLVELSKVRAHRILSVNDLDFSLLKGIETLGVTAGASTPPQLVDHIIKFFEQFNYDDKATYQYNEFDYNLIFKTN